MKILELHITIIATNITYNLDPNSSLNLNQSIHSFKSNKESKKKKIEISEIKRSEPDQYGPDLSVFQGSIVTKLILCILSIEPKMRSKRICFIITTCTSNDKRYTE